VPAEELARTTITIEVLDRLARTLQGDSLEAALRWIAGGANARSLAYDIERAVTRIHALVASVKGFTHMDQAPVATPVDVSRGLNDTVAILDGKARGKSVTITLTVTPDLPPIRGIGGEVNQVWMNLIDNAIDAAPDRGQVDVTAEQEGTCVVVRVIDDGAGIPTDIQERIFDPFFTTKPVGGGTGLGLDIVRRIVQWHNGEIEVISRPGRTEFCVKMPVAG
jgi:signal transduction histidine kinase